MENRAHALAAGAFLLALSLAAAAALWWLSGKRDFTRDYVLVSTGNVTGLNPEAQVRYRGMRAGKVQDIELDPADRRNILVTIRIDADLPITRSTRAQLAVQGITGLAYVQLSDSGASKQALAAGEDGLVRLPLEPSQWDQLSESAAGLIAQVRNLQQVTAGQRCGLEFDYQANRHMKSLETQALLGRIEGILERSEAFRQRVAPAGAKAASDLY